ncbi:MAG: hypothetical protein ABFD89_00705 [Bryobacteraceae bacterium]
MACYTSIIDGLRQFAAVAVGFVAGVAVTLTVAYVALKARDRMIEIRGE